MNGLFVCAVAIKDDDYLVRCMAVPVDELVNQELACSGKILRSKSLKRRISFNYVVAIDQDIASHCVCYPFCCWIVYLDKIGYPGINVNIKSHSFVFCERSAGGVAVSGGLCACVGVAVPRAPGSVIERCVVVVASVSM